MHEKTRQGIDNSDVFLAIVTPNYITDPDAIEQAMYANAKKKPVILLLEKEAKMDDVKELFRDTVIVDVIPFKKGDDSYQDEVVKSIKNFAGKQKKT